MKMVEIKEKAKKMGLKPGKRNKTNLIRTIQEKEGNFPCYETANNYCDQSACSWRNDCLQT